MARFILGRLLTLPLLLAGVSVLIFLMLRIGPGDPALDYLRLSQLPPTPANIAETRAMLGLDRPWLEQYLAWASAALRLDFGLSHATRRPVLDDMLLFLPATLQLAGVALLLTLAVSIPLGVWAANHRDGWQDHLVRGFAFLGVSAPSFWIAFLFIMAFSVGLGLLPPFGKGGIEHILMPALAVSIMSLSVNARLLRAGMLDMRGQRHVTWARMRGVPEAAVTRRHVLRNALLPIVTASGMHLGELIGGAMVIETVFAWPGIGRYAVTAIYNRDYPVLQCFVLMMTALFAVLNLLTDIAHAWLDPRVRFGSHAGAGA